MPSPSLRVALRRDRQRYPHPSHYLLFRCLPALVVTVLVLLLLSAVRARAGALPEEVGAGQLLLSAGGQSYTRALVQATRADIDISGMIARVRIEQTFSNTGADWAEGVYAFPLPETAAVRSLVMQVGERRIVGRIAERAAARKTYQQARDSGRKASLVEQQRPNFFTTRVANIGPGEAVAVTLEYVQDVSFREGLFSLRLPTTITPRFMPGRLLAADTEAQDQPAGETAGEGTALPLSYHGWALPTTAVADADRLSPPQYPQPGSDAHPLNPLTVAVTLDAGLPVASVESPYHAITLANTDTGYRVALAQGPAEMDRDFVLQWRPLADSVPAAALFTERVGDGYYGLLMVLPPALADAPEPAAREVVIVVDTSGSMGGASIRQARASVDKALLQLRPGDRFNVIAFSDSHRALFARSRQASPHHIALAREFVRHLHASGGTQMLPALEAALAPAGAQHEADAPLRQVIFITDGAIGNEDALFSAIQARLGSSRLFTVGIGSAPNSWFMRQAADLGRGTFTYIGNVDEVSEQMNALFRQLSRPAAVDVSVNWPAGVETWPQRVPDLYYGEPLSVAVRFGEQLPGGVLRVSGRSGGQQWTRSIALPGADAAAPATEHAGVASLWARRKIAQLLAGRYRGVDETALRAAVLPLALEHALLSPYTSFVAVETVVARPDGAGLRSGAVPNSRPRGQAAQGYAYAATATTAPARIWLGTLLLLALCVVRALTQEDSDG